MTTAPVSSPSTAVGGVGAILDTYFDDVDSLSRASALTSDLQRQTTQLEEQLAAVRVELPAALGQVQREAAEAAARLDGLNDDREQLMTGVERQRDVSEALAAKLSRPLARIRALDEARLVLRVLVKADDLALEVQAQPDERTLLRLHALRACVSGAAAEEQEQGGERAVGGEARLAVPLLRLLDERVGKLADGMRGPLAARLADALGDLGWPGEVSAAALDGATLQAVRAAFGALLVLQHVAQPVAEARAAEAAEAAEGGLWAVETLLQPVARRFRHHFEERRETNRRDKPEWVFAHCAALLRLHRPLLSRVVQPLLLAPLPALLGALGGAEARLGERERFVRFVALRCPHGAYLALGAALCARMQAKLRREMDARLEPGRADLFEHALNEAARFEAELRAEHGVPPAAGGVLRAFYAPAEPAAEARGGEESWRAALQHWLQLERDDGAAALDRLAPDAMWLAPSAAHGGAPPVGADGAPPPPPPCASGLLSLLGGVHGRLALMHDAAAQLEMLHKVSLPLLASWTARLRRRATQLMLVEAREPGTWAAVGGLLHATAHCAPRLGEWCDAEPLGALLPREVPAAEGTAPGASAGGAYGDALAEWAELGAELERHVAETVGAVFERAAAAYLERDERHNNYRVDVASVGTSRDLSASLGAPRLALRAELRGAHAALPLASFRRAARLVGAALDELLWRALLRCTACSAAGAAQLAHDVRALLDEFVFERRGDALDMRALLRRTNEAARLLALPAAARAALLPALLAADAEPSAEVAAALAAHGVCWLGAHEVKEVLANVHDV